jgi:hypothetical protein
MKRLVFLVFGIGLAVSLFAQVQLPEYQFAFASGNWGFIGSRLYQNDTGARLAKVNIRAPQSGAMIYEFNARYEDGVQDGHGGFGLHIFTDTAYNGASWGAGHSYLLWLNYDEAPITQGIPRGFSAQVYKSVSNSQMDLVESVSLNQYLPLLTWENISSPVPFRIWVNGDTGEIRVYDPSDPDLSNYYYFYVDRRDLPLRGDWISLRTNGIKLSFGLGL